MGTVLITRIGFMIYAAIITYIAVCAWELSRFIGRMMKKYRVK